MQDITRHRLVDDAAGTIKKAIIDGRIAPGARLVQNRLAAMLGISRTPIREALQRLEREGLVRSTGLQGMVVTRLSSKDVRETQDLREVLDGLAARLAADLIPEGQLEDLRKLLDRMAVYSEKGDRRRWLEANRFFHDSIARAAQNLPLLQTMATIQTSLDLFAPYVWSLAERRSLSDREHRQIYEALASRDAPEAERHARDHAQMVKTAVLEVLAELDSGELKPVLLSRKRV